MLIVRLMLIASPSLDSILDSLLTFAQDTLSPPERDYLFGIFLESRRCRKIKLAEFQKKHGVHYRVSRESAVKKLRDHLAGLGVQGWSDIEI